MNKQTWTETRFGQGRTASEKAATVLINKVSLINDTGPM